MIVLTIAHVATQPHLHPWQWMALSVLAVLAAVGGLRSLLRKR